MTKYTVAMATYYNNSQHLDYSTESNVMSEIEVIHAGHELANRGAFPLYTEYVDGIRGRILIEDNAHLVMAFGL